MPWTSALWWPPRGCCRSAWPVVTSQRWTVRSKAPEPRVLPSGEKATAWTWFSCPCSVRASRGPFILVLEGLSRRVRVHGQAGVTGLGPYLLLNLETLAPGEVL